MALQYHVCTTPLLWNDRHALHSAVPVSRHRLLDRARQADERMQARCKRVNGPETAIDTRILATADGGETYRRLTEAEALDLF